MSETQTAVETDINALQIIDGIGPSAIRGLQDSGYESVEDLYEVDAKTLSNAKGVGRQSARNIKIALSLGERTVDNSKVNNTLIRATEHRSLAETAASYGSEGAAERAAAFDAVIEWLSGEYPDLSEGSGIDRDKE